MDPASIISIVEGSVSLALQCGSAAKRLSDVASQYKAAELTIMSMSQNLSTMQLAWKRIGEWSKNHPSESVSDHDEDLWQKLEESVEVGRLVLNALEADILQYKKANKPLSISLRSKLIWNQATLNAHRGRIQDQAQSMTLLLSAIKL